MLPFLGFAAVALYAGYVAYDTSRARERAAATPRAPDPIHELERINTELSRAATQARKSLESARDAMSSGLKG